MSFWKLAAGSVWVSLGTTVLVASLLVGQRSAVWGTSSNSRVEISDHQHGLDGEEEIKMAERLPESEVMPGEIDYPFKVVSDWLWWRLAGSNREKSRRLLHLANERLRSGWELCRQGRTGLAVETLMKAEGYLASSINSEDINQDLNWKEELENSAQLHFQLLSDLEESVPEEVRPRVTELLDIPKLVAVKEIK